ncbi:hypothetical protein MGG_16107 [Pyricularia oryzae 70-15]|uniref:Uncharacterized protein n=1 Tax=Pyricularia oryzae (strain 70-15 / ATCC MYA-4617 / FGSC 8958) TaxID=242507 RepID=G4MQZ7_PYRO7|nr:uncharacterized protein MGG_16107 [Pyricularia oryzae 70-15]EHA56532.1 hypothetical protein MGG_16107 [Pyricularia oryzae 70-15]
MSAVVWIVVQPRRRHPSVEAVHDGGRTPGIFPGDARAGEVALVPAERAVGNTAWEVRWPWAAPTAVEYLEQRSLTAGAPVGFYENQEGRQGQNSSRCLAGTINPSWLPSSHRDRISRWAAYDRYASILAEELAVRRVGRYASGDYVKAEVKTLTQKRY